MPSKNLFASVLTHAAPSSNYRGESEENRTVLQKITRGNVEHTVISPESMRNALREILAARELPCNRRRLHDEEQLAVEFKEFPNADKYADDFLFGFMVADKDAIKTHKGQPAKRDSTLRMNLAVSLAPYRFDATFHQSPLNAGASPWRNSTSSALLHREIAYTAYQYPFALAGGDCKTPTQRQWMLALLEAIGELSNVAGGHARSYFEMAPRSVVGRVTRRLVAGFDTYGFHDNGEKFPDLVRIHKNDLPGKEFWLGGDLVRKLPEAERQRLAGEGVHLHDNPQAALADMGRALFEEA